METKIFEVRDRATFLPVLAVRLAPANEQDAYLLMRCGYRVGTNIMLTPLSGDRRATCDVYNHDTATLREAHEYIMNEWKNLVTGQVICLEYLRGERSTPKLSERLDT